MKKSYMSKKTQRKDFTEHRTNKYFGFLEYMVCGGKVESAFTNSMKVM